MYSVGYTGTARRLFGSLRLTCLTCRLVLACLLTVLRMPFPTVYSGWPVIGAAAKETTEELHRNRRCRSIPPVCRDELQYIGTTGANRIAVVLTGR